MSKYYQVQSKCDPKFNNKDNSLTMYGLACGYIENYDIDSDNRISLELSSIFHVKGFIDGVRIWDSFDRECLKDARKAFIKYCKQIDKSTKE